MLGDPPQCGKLKLPIVLPIRRSIVLESTPVRARHKPTVNAAADLQPRRVP